MTSKKLSIQIRKDLKHIFYAWAISCIIAAIYYASIYQECTPGLKTIGNLGCLLSQESLGLQTLKLHFMTWSTGVLSIGIFKLTQDSQDGIRPFHIIILACLMLLILTIDLQVGYPVYDDKLETSEFVLTE